MDTPPPSDFTLPAGYYTALTVTLDEADLPHGEDVAHWAEQAYGVPCRITEHEESS